MFVGPGAPQTNTIIQAANFKKACDKFVKKVPNAEGFTKQAHWGKTVAVFYNLRRKQY